MKNEKGGQMKPITKSIILIVMAAVLAVLIIIPVDLFAGGVIKPGVKARINGIDTCVCPQSNGDCQCLILDPSTDN